MYTTKDGSLQYIGNDSPPLRHHDAGLDLEDGWILALRALRSRYYRAVLPGNTAVGWQWYAESQGVGHRNHYFINVPVNYAVRPQFAMIGGTLGPLNKQVDRQAALLTALSQSMQNLYRSGQ